MSCASRDSNSKVRETRSTSLSELLNMTKLSSHTSVNSSSHSEESANSGGDSGGGEYEGSNSGNDNANLRFAACTFLALWA